MITLKNKYGSNSRLLFTDANSLVYEINTKMFIKILARIKKSSILATIQLSQNIMIIQSN